MDDRPDDIALCLIDFDDATVSGPIDSPPDLVRSIFGTTGDSGKFRVYRNRLLFLVANRNELERAIELAREFKAISNILKSPTRMEDLSGSQQKQLKERQGTKDLEVRIALTNAYRHLFYPDRDPVKAPDGLRHHTLPAIDSSTVKGKNNQQDALLKTLEDCQKIRSSGERNPLAPAFILQKVWSAGKDSLTTRELKEAFAKDIALKFLIEAEVSLLRDTIRRGLQEGQWDLKIGEKLYLKTDDRPAALPETIEFSDRVELYRRGILKPPEPRFIELNASVIAGGGTSKTVRVRWKARNALTVSLYRDDTPVGGTFRPSDEYETEIEATTRFRLLVDYGNGETETRETGVSFESGRVAERGERYSVSGNGGDLPLFEPKPECFTKEGSVERVFNELKDFCADYKVREIDEIALLVADAMGFRKITTALPLLSRYRLAIDLTATVQTGEGFVRLEYQGTVRGFQPFQNTLNGLLSDPKVQSDIKLQVTLDLAPPLAPDGLNALHTALERNPVDRLYLTAKVHY